MINELYAITIHYLPVAILTFSLIIAVITFSINSLCLILRSTNRLEKKINDLDYELVTVENSVKKLASKVDILWEKNGDEGYIFCDDLHVSATNDRVGIGYGTVKNTTMNIEDNPPKKRKKGSS